MAGRTRDKELGEELASVGLRATAQRVGVLRLLRRLESHPTSSELFTRLRREQPNVSQKTVYDVLDALVASGLACRVTDGGEPYRYEGRTQPHYHARCRVCGRLVDLPAKADSQIRGRTPLPDGFVVEDIRVTLEGVCQRCRNEV